MSVTHGRCQLSYSEIHFSTFMQWAQQVILLRS